MMSIAIEIYFKNKDVKRLNSDNWLNSSLEHWKLNSRDVYQKYEFKWSYPLECSYIMPAKEFLELVGSNEEEALEILYNKYSKEYDTKEYITPEVKEFYKDLERTELLYVNFTLVDQS